MKVVTCVSYHGTGSSAITDLLSEFACIHNMSNYEFRFAHDIDGIANLEYHLVDNFNRHNSGHALKRYKWLVDYYGDHLFVKRYEPFFHGLWKEISYRYIEALTDFKFNGSWQYDYYDRGPLFSFIFKFPQRVMSRTIWRGQPDKTIDMLSKEVTYCCHLPNREKFLQLTREYTNSLFKAANQKLKPFLMIDQVLPSSNIAWHMRYFEDICAIIVDRDPRDLFVLAKYYWNDPVVPKDVKTFCKWFKYVRYHQAQEINNDRVKFVHFEDLVYQYEDTKNQIASWLHLPISEQTRKFSCFNPEISFKNTKVWTRCNNALDEIVVIEKELPEYLYPFE